jgi:hypothetical protein
MRAARFSRAGISPFVLLSDLFYLLCIKKEEAVDIPGMRRAGLDWRNVGRYLEELDPTRYLTGAPADLGQLGQPARAPG